MDYASMSHGELEALMNSEHMVDLRKAGKFQELSDIGRIYTEKMQASLAKPRPRSQKLDDFWASATQPEAKPEPALDKPPGRHGYSYPGEPLPDASVGAPGTPVERWTPEGAPMPRWHPEDGGVANPVSASGDVTIARDVTNPLGVDPTNPEGIVKDPTNPKGTTWEPEGKTIVSSTKPGKAIPHGMPAVGDEESWAEFIERQNASPAEKAQMREEMAGAQGRRTPRAPDMPAGFDPDTDTPPVAPQKDVKQPAPGEPGKPGKPMKPKSVPEMAMDHISVREAYGTADPDSVAYNLASDIADRNGISTAEAALDIKMASSTPEELAQMSIPKDKVTRAKQRIAGAVNAKKAKETPADIPDARPKGTPKTTPKTKTPKPGRAIPETVATKTAKKVRSVGDDLAPKASKLLGTKSGKVAVAVAGVALISALFGNKNEDAVAGVEGQFANASVSHEGMSQGTGIGDQNRNRKMMSQRENESRAGSFLNSGTSSARQGLAVRTTQF